MRARCIADGGGPKNDAGQVFDRGKRIALKVEIGGIDLSVALTDHGNISDKRGRAIGFDITKYFY
jgi:hypothetical protein